MVYQKSKLNKIIVCTDELPGHLKDSLVSQPCFCGSDSFTAISDTTRHGTGVNLGKCMQCGTIQIIDYPNNDDLSWYYTNVYRALKHSDRTPAETFRYQLKHENKIKKFLQPYLSDVNDVLDYGGASGGRFHFLTKESNKNLFIYDLDEKFVSFAMENGLKPHQIGLKYDLICFYHVVEHMVDPLNQLKAIINDHLNDEGSFLIAVPPAETAVLRNGFLGLLKDMHIAHRFYFTSENITYLGALLGLRLVSHSSDMYLFKKTPGLEIKGLKSISLSESNKNITKLKFYSYFIYPMNAFKNFFKKVGLSGVITKLGRIRAKLIHET